MVVVVVVVVVVVGVGHFIYYPKRMIGKFAQLVYFSYNTAYCS